MLISNFELVCFVLIKDLIKKFYLSFQTDRNNEFSACDFKIYFDGFNDYFILVEAIGVVKIEYHVNSK